MQMSDLTWNVILIPLFPLLGFLLNVFVIRQERAAGLVASGAVALSFVASLIAIYVLQTLPAGQSRIDFVLWQWINIGSFRVPFGLLFDRLTAVMALLVMGDNLLLLFLGWEGVGLCSFLLIGHWFDRKSVPPGIVPSDAAVKAFVVNRIGDAGLLLAMMALFASFGSLSFYTQNVGGSEIAGYLERAELGGSQVV